eukprot:CAMPEP_0202691268 /NCGR_PEP_ID=MMETSP1385-20130828/6031_1 /ASSEMBLY_ACC=CAM_ASM_000861 /TAXON_ID=933848 /ORGANISM="Elphidium margaritaceum" /LENGTH=174 /DNA_ID=CAMNT_0049346641 /DNA_START=84 /DNA_END=605 /DNA_ORIENTATION=-
MIDTKSYEYGATDAILPKKEKTAQRWCASKMAMALFAIVATALMVYWLSAKQNDARPDNALLVQKQAGELELLGVVSDARSSGGRSTGGGRTSGGGGSTTNEACVWCVWVPEPVRIALPDCKGCPPSTSTSSGGDACVWCVWVPEPVRITLPDCQACDVDSGSGGSSGGACEAW